MKLPENTTLVGVQICRNDNDVLLTTAQGKAIRFNTEDIRIFKGRDSVGVKGITMKKDDTVIFSSKIIPGNEKKLSKLHKQY